MRLRATERFVSDYRALPADIRERTDRKLRYLAADLRHPSVRVKRVPSRQGIYEGSINMDYRFLFSVEGDAIILLRIGRHDIIDKR